VKEGKGGKRERRGKVGERGREEFSHLFHHILTTAPTPHYDVVNKKVTFRYLIS